NNGILVTPYEITNIFVYNITTNSVIQVITGADNSSYSGPSNFWNSNDYGEGFCRTNVNHNYVIGTSILTDTFGNIYWKPSVNNSFYKSTNYVEIGVAQIWGLTAGNSAYAKNRLIRIWNIQSDGSLVASARNFWQAPNGGMNVGIVNIIYDSYYDSIIIQPYQADALHMIKASNFTGYSGTVTSGTPYITALKLIGDGATNGLYYTQKLVTSGNGSIAVFGPHYPAFTNVFGSAFFSNSNITTQTNTPTFTVTGNPPALGLYNTDTLPQLYIPSTNEYWILGRGTLGGVPIINIYNATTLILQSTLDIIALGYALPETGFTKIVYHPTRNEILLYDNVGVLLAFDVPNRTVNINTTVLTLYSAFEYIGSIVPYGDSYYIDIHDSSGFDESWMKVIDGLNTFTGSIHNFITATIDYNLLPTITNENVWSSTAIASTTGQWKITSSSSWASIVGGGTINISPNDIIEFTMFSPTIKLISIENITQSFTYDPLVYQNTLNSIPTFAIKADNITLNNGDQLEFTFYNPYIPSCPFINQVLISF
ncbi:MAG: hypothetical protein WCK31_05360, partial [bacterium]